MPKQSDSLANPSVNFEHDMCIISIAGTDFIVPVKDAAVIMQALNKAEVRRHESIPDHAPNRDGSNRYAYVIKHMDDGLVSIRSISLVQLISERNRWQEWHDAPLPGSTMPQSA